MRRACIDVGSNTTRLLVAECSGGRLVELHQERTFTHIGRGLREDPEIPLEKINRVATVVASQVQAAKRLGSVDIQGVATAAIRRAKNREDLLTGIQRASGLEVRILSEQDEARLAFVGAAGTLGHAPEGDLGVVDVGGGSSELIVGTTPDRVSWSISFGLGSGDLADECLRSDPPSASELQEARARVTSELGGLEVPHPVEAVAVGGNATSLRLLAGSHLDAAAFARSLSILAAGRASEVASRFGLHVERVRLLPAGLLILQAASELFGGPLGVGRGGVREGVLLEANGA